MSTPIVPGMKIQGPHGQVWEMLDYDLRDPNRVNAKCIVAGDKNELVGRVSFFYAGGLGSGSASAGWSIMGEGAPTPTRAKSGGLRCMGRCGEFYEYAVPNQPDGKSLKCWGCTH